MCRNVVRTNFLAVLGNPESRAYWLRPVGKQDRKFKATACYAVFAYYMNTELGAVKVKQHALELA